MNEAANVMSDLAAEGDAVDQLVCDLEPSGWATPTPAPDWTVAHQIAHLAATFRMATLSAADPEAFTAMAAGLGSDFDANVRRALGQFVNDPPEVLLARWREERAAAGKALGALPPDRLVPWLVRPLPAATLAAAGLMELFGHGQDIADALGIRRVHTDRLLHLVGFAVRTWDFGYLARGLEVPAAALRFEIVGPSGALWEFGPDDSTERITGSAVDFCLLVTRRRHHEDLNVLAQGETARGWLEVAQAYRGPAGAGRRPGQFEHRES